MSLPSIFSSTVVSALAQWIAVVVLKYLRYPFWCNKRSSFNIPDASLSQTPYKLNLSL